MNLAIEIMLKRVRQGEIAVFWLGQAGFLIKDSGGRTIAIDPYLTDCCERVAGFKRLSPKLISPEELKLPSSVKLHIKEKNLEYKQYSDLMAVIPEVDILYMTRIQKERFSDPLDYEKVKNSYVLRNAMLEKSRPNLKIMHPLPRVNEISIDVDSNPHAYYFTQALNGVYVRQAILAEILGVKVD